VSTDFICWLGPVDALAAPLSAESSSRGLFVAWEFRCCRKEGVRRLSPTELSLPFNIGAHNRTVQTAGMKNRRSEFRNSLIGVARGDDNFDAKCILSLSIDLSRSLED
jgi:hypothetical protein